MLFFCGLSDSEPGLYWTIARRSHPTACAKFITPAATGQTLIRRETATAITGAGKILQGFARCCENWLAADDSGAD